MERSTMLLIGKPSISMGHLYHGYVKIEIEPPNSSYSKGGSQPMSLVLGYVAYNCHGYGSFDGFLPATLGANLMGYNDLYFKACCHCKVKMGFPNHWPKSISNLLCQFEVQLGSISALNHIKPLFLLVTPPQTDGKLQNNMACIYGHIYIYCIYILYIYTYIYIYYACMYHWWDFIIISVAVVKTIAISQIHGIPLSFTVHRPIFLVKPYKPRWIILNHEWS